jgi:hypothetical protein
VDQKKLDNLIKSISTSYRGLETYRNTNARLGEEYAGSGYGKPSARETVVNLTNQAVNAYIMSLAANDPRVLVTTQKIELKRFAKHYEIAINNLIREINLGSTIRRWILDAFFMLGIVKVHLADSAPVQIEQDVWMDPGTPFASNVGLDYFVFDFGATKRGEMKYQGDMYRIPFEDLKNDLYDQSVVKELTPTTKQASASRPSVPASRRSSPTSTRMKRRPRRKPRRRPTTSGFARRTRRESSRRCTTGQTRWPRTSSCR